MTAKRRYCLNVLHAHIIKINTYDDYGVAALGKPILSREANTTDEEMAVCVDGLNESFPAQEERRVAQAPRFYYALNNNIIDRAGVMDPINMHDTSREEIALLERTLESVFGGWSRVDRRKA